MLLVIKRMFSTEYAAKPNKSCPPPLLLFVVLGLLAFFAAQTTLILFPETLWKRVCNIIYWLGGGGGGGGSSFSGKSLKSLGERERGMKDEGKRKISAAAMKYNMCCSE